MSNTTPRTALGKKLIAIRERIEASGTRLKTFEEINSELDILRRKID